MIKHFKTTLALTTGAAFLMSSTPSFAGYLDDQNDFLSKFRRKIILHIQNDGPDDQSMDIGDVGIVPYIPIGPPSFWDNTPDLIFETTELGLSDEWSSVPSPPGDSLSFAPDPSLVPWTYPVNPGITLDPHGLWTSVPAADTWTNSVFDVADTFTGSPIPAPGVLSLLLLAGIRSGRRRDR